MYHLSTEHIILKSKSSLVDNIAHHIREYQIYGRVVVITDSPPNLLAEIKEAWYDLKREMRREITHTKDSEHKSRLVNQLMYMQHCTFTDKPPIEETYEQVQVTTTQEVLRWAPTCQTMYVTCPMKPDEIHRATAWMPPYGLVVLYE